MTEYNWHNIAMMAYEKYQEHLNMGSWWPGLFAFLLGPLISYRRRKPSNIGVIGLLVIGIVYVLYVLLCAFCQGRSDCPSWLNVRSLDAPIRQYASLKLSGRRA